MYASSSTKKRSVILFQSIVAFLLGSVLLLFPGSASRSVILVISLYLIVDGGLTLLSKADSRSKISVVLGALAVAIGIVGLVNPSLLGFPLVFFLAGWALIHSLMNLSELVSPQSNKRQALWFGLSGGVLMGLAIWMFGHMGAAAMIMIRWIGIFGVIYGYTLLGLSNELKHDDKKVGVQDDRRVDSEKAA